MYGILKIAIHVGTVCTRHFRFCFRFVCLLYVYALLWISSLYIIPICFHTKLSRPKPTQIFEGPKIWTNVPNLCYTWRRAIMVATNMYMSRVVCCVNETCISSPRVKHSKCLHDKHKLLACHRNRELYNSIFLYVNVYRFISRRYTAAWLCGQIIHPLCNISTAVKYDNATKIEVNFRRNHAIPTVVFALYCLIPTVMNIFHRFRSNSGHLRLV